MSFPETAPRSPNKKGTPTMNAATQELVLAAAGSGININSTQPPGTQGIITVVNYVAWGAFAACLVGFVIAAATMAWKHHRGEEAASMKGLGMSLLGTVLIGAAGAIVGSVT
jgi:hypothetical protein